MTDAISLNARRAARGKRRSRFSEFWRRFRKNKLSVFALCVILLMIFCAIFCDVIAPYDPMKQVLKLRFKTPSAAHIMGTDNFGRDIFTRVLYGTRISLFVGVVSVCIGMFGGGLLGSLAGYYGKRVDNAIMRLMDMMMSVPSLILAIAICATLGPGLINAMISIGISSIPTFARVVRSAVLSVKQQEYVEAARALGASNARIILRHLIANSMAPIIVQASLGVASAITSAANLSFIGLGVQPPTAEWGSMLSAGRNYIRQYPHLILYPGLAIFTTIICLNLVGDGLRDALDPKLKR